jgi:hypothetical protein
MKWTRRRPDPQTLPPEIGVKVYFIFNFLVIYGIILLFKHLSEQNSNKKLKVPILI